MRTGIAAPVLALPGKRPAWKHAAGTGETVETAGVTWTRRPVARRWTR